MKKQAFLFLSLLLATGLLFASCASQTAGNGSSANSSSPANAGGTETQTSAPAAETLPPIKAPSKQELEYEQKRFSTGIQDLSSWEKIDFVRLSSGRFSVYNLDLTDTSEIRQWVELAKAMKVTAVAFEPHGGTLGYELSFHSGEQSISLGGGFVDGHIYVSGDNCTKVMLRIDNYSDLKETFEALQKTAGFPKPE